MSLTLSVLVPVIDETHSVNTTIEEVERSSKNAVLEYIFLVCKKTTAESLLICQAWEKKDPQRFRVLFQTLPFLGGACRDGFAAARGTHVLVMSSDLETDPKSVGAMVAAAEANPGAIIAASRWLARGQFSGYSPSKLVANYFFQKFFRILYWTHASDLTFGFRILPMATVRRIRWEGIRHELMFETLIKPLRLGLPVVEVSTPWVARIEGVSHNPLFEHWRYVVMGLRTRFLPMKDLLVSE